MNNPAENLTAEHPLQNALSLLTEYLWLVWLAVALAILIRKITAYQSFLRYISAGSLPVPDLELLDRLALAAEQAGVKRPVELSVHPMLSSPMLVGLFRPCIVLPSADISQADFRYIVLHELTHYKRRDVLYKWLVQVTICLHWFNPLVYLMGREITSACEFSCDEAVLARIGDGNPQEYGKTLLDAMAAVGKYQEAFGAAPLSENKELLKGRLSAIMNFKKKSGVVWFLTGALTAALLLGAAFAGISPAVVAADAGTFAGNSPAPTQAGTPGPTPAQSGTPELAPAKNSAPAPVPTQSIAPDPAPTQTEDTPDKEDEFDEWMDAKEKEGAEAPTEEYQVIDVTAGYRAVGVTKEGKNYYYQGQLVNIFLDIRPNKSFYTFDMNPAGTVNVKIVRSADGQITGAAYMTEAEVAELLSGD